MNLHELVSNLTKEQKQTLLDILSNENNLEINLDESRFLHGLFCPKCGSMTNIIKK